MARGEIVPTSVAVLRDLGPLDLREIARETAKRMNCTQWYADVDGTLRAAQERGEVVLVAGSGDYRNQIWRAA